MAFFILVYFPWGLSSGILGVGPAGHWVIHSWWSWWDLWCRTRLSSCDPWPGSFWCRWEPWSIWSSWNPWCRSRLDPWSRSCCRSSLIIHSCCRSWWDPWCRSCCRSSWIIHSCSRSCWLIHSCWSRWDPGCRSGWFRLEPWLCWLTIASHCYVTSHVFPLCLPVKELPLSDVLRTCISPNTFDPAIVRVRSLSNTPGAVTPFVHLIVEISRILPVLLSFYLGVAANCPRLPIAICPPAICPFQLPGCCSIGLQCDWVTATSWT